MAAPVSASVAVIFAGAPVLATYTQIFMPALGGFVVSFFPLLITGAIFGKLMAETGYAQAIADAIVKRLRPDRAVLATATTGALLTYGGISVFVVAFGLFPVARELFRAADIPAALCPRRWPLARSRLRCRRCQIHRRFRTPSRRPISGQQLLRHRWLDLSPRC